MGFFGKQSSASTMLHTCLYIIQHNLFFPINIYDISELRASIVFKKKILSH